MKAPAQFRLSILLTERNVWRARVECLRECPLPQGSMQALLGTRTLRASGVRLTAKDVVVFVAESDFTARRDAWAWAFAFAENFEGRE